MDRNGKDGVDTQMCAGRSGVKPCAFPPCPALALPCPATPCHGPRPLQLPWTEWTVYREFAVCLSTKNKYQGEEEGSLHQVRHATPVNLGRPSTLHLYPTPPCLVNVCIYMKLLHGPLYPQLLPIANINPWYDASSDCGASPLSPATCVTLLLPSWNDDDDQDDEKEG